MNVIEDLQAFILEELAVDAVGGAVDPDEDLLASGLIDSLGVVQLASFMERRYGIEVGDDDVVPENFRTIAALAKFIRGKKPA